jgi:CRP-like cAMP-binding protein/predicted GNAT family N-acyltransferase
MSLTVELATSNVDLHAIYQFRYRIYVNEFNLDPPDANHDDKTLKDDLDDISQSFALIDNNEIVGSLRLLFFEDANNLSPLIKKYNCQLAVNTFGPKAICATSRFMLTPKLRSGRVIYKLMTAGFKEACRRGARFNFGDCSPHILPFYEHLGYRRYTKAYNDTAYGYKLPILMLIRDQERFKQVRSPLLRIASDYEDDGELRNWFETNYSEYLDMETAAFLSEDGFFDMLSARVGSDPLHNLSLLHNMERDEADKILKMGTLIRSHSGDKIIRQGETDNTVYVMLKGIAEIVLDHAPDKPVALLAAGDTFGEIGLVAETPRTATVVARSDCEVLVISGQFLQNCIRKEPTIAAKLLVNLSKALAEKLSLTTAKLGQELV